MNAYVKYGLIGLGGAVLGAIGTLAIVKNKETLKPLATALVSRGLDVKDAVQRGLETAKETIDDIVAEARAKSEERKTEKTDGTCESCSC